MTEFSESKVKLGWSGLIRVGKSVYSLHRQVTAAGQRLEFYLQRLYSCTVATTLKNYLVVNDVVVVRWEWT